LLNYALTYFDRVWLHIAPTNIRSQKATLKLGAIFVAEHEVSLGGKPASLTRSYKIEKAQWKKSQSV
jgi:RimJ/RimL family protein N-acetyltransferase